MRRISLKPEVQMLKDQIAQLQKMVYGSRTERTTRILPEIADGQLNLFNEAEVEAKRNAQEPCIEVPAHQRRKKQKDHTAELLASSRMRNVSSRCRKKSASANAAAQP